METLNPRAPQPGEYTPSPLERLQKRYRVIRTLIVGALLAYLAIAGLYELRWKMPQSASEVPAQPLPGPPELVPNSP